MGVRPVASYARGAETGSFLPGLDWASVQVKQRLVRIQPLRLTGITLFLFAAKVNDLN
jgi:hypothetical protein